MPSRTLPRPNTSIISACRKSMQPQIARSFSLQSSTGRVTASRQPFTSRTTTIGLPLRSRLHTTTVQHANVEETVISGSDASHLPLSMVQSSQYLDVEGSAPTNIGVFEAPGNADSKPLVLSKSLQALLPALKAQKPQYITTHIHSFPYLLTEGDTLRLPFHMHGVSAGDVLRFNRATIIGSRDFTLKAGYSSPQHTSPSHTRGEAFVNKRRTGEPSYIDERLFECRMRVMGLDSGPMMIKEKKKRRNRRIRKVTSKHKYTVLKVMEVRVKSLEELTSLQGEQVVLE